MAESVYLQYAALEEIIRRVNFIKEAFDEIGLVEPGAVNPTVAEAYEDFGGRWDKRRQQLADGLTALADVLGSFIEAFQQVDSDLAVAVTEPDGRPATNIKEN